MTNEVSIDTVIDLYLSSEDGRHAGKIDAESISRSFNAWCERTRIPVSPADRTQGAAKVVQKLMARRMAHGLNAHHATAPAKCPTCGK